ncbi:hypothetical protein POVWA2_012940 [Plasmodium ovale wallikeri]|uniref:Uncharacterized protein n=1 Tax=Plasmodium ovale wallikeri TaxID=864142 RepID=A0A1A8YNI1_PLAOA|nr:hypothetical protein POVWA2_012940 [Plasmodium ovale wallikeri]
MKGHSCMHLLENIFTHTFECIMRDDMGKKVDCCNLEGRKSHLKDGEEHKNSKSVSNILSMFNTAHKNIPTYEYEHLLKQVITDSNNLTIRKKDKNEKKSSRCSDEKTVENIHHKILPCDESQTKEIQKQSKGKEHEEDYNNARSINTLCLLPSNTNTKSFISNKNFYLVKERNASKKGYHVIVGENKRDGSKSEERRKKKIKVSGTMGVGRNSEDSSISTDNEDDTRGANMKNEDNFAKKEKQLHSISSPILS